MSTNSYTCDSCSNPIVYIVFQCKVCNTALHPGCVKAYSFKRRCKICCKEISNFIKFSNKRDNKRKRETVNLDENNSLVNIESGTNIKPKNSQVSSNTVRQTTTMTDTEDPTLTTDLRSFMAEVRLNNTTTNEKLDTILEVKPELLDLRDRVNKIESGETNVLSSVVRFSGIRNNITMDPLNIIIQVLTAIKLSNPMSAVADVMEFIPKSKPDNAMITQDIPISASGVSESSGINTQNDSQSFTQNENFVPTQNENFSKTFFVTLSNHSVKQAVIRRMADKKVLSVKEVFNLNISGRIFINEMYDKDTYINYS